MIETTSPSEGQRDRPLRVVQVIGQLNVGGAERHVVNLTNALAGTTRSVVLTGRQRPGVSLLPRLDSDVAIHALHIRRRGMPQGILRLARLFRDLRCDVVQSHMYWSNLCSAIAARIAGVPVMITTEHGENRWKHGGHGWIERRVVSRFADRRFCVSDAILRRRLEFDRVPASRLLLMPNGTVVPETKVEVRTGGPLTIGTVGRMVPEKDPGNLLAAVQALCAGGHRIRVVAVGDGPELAPLKARVAEIGLQDVFVFPGMVEDVESWYRRFDVFVLSSRQEGQPVALLEAMAIGLPCVATDVGGITQTLASGTEGTVVPAGSPEALAEGLRTYLDSPAARAEHGAAARARVRRDFSIEAVAARHLEEYRRILRSKTASMEAVTS